MQQLKELMSRDVKVIGPDMTIGEAAREMRDGDFGMMPVVEDDRIIGTISDRDIAIRAVAEGKGAGTKVRDVISLGLRGRVGRTGRHDHERAPGAAFAGRGPRQAAGRHRGAGRFCRRKLGIPAGCAGAFAHLEAIMIQHPDRRQPPDYYFAAASSFSVNR
jgi:hypothetical protein